MLLGLNSLVQSVAPATTLHDTTSLLVNDLHLAVDNHILVVLIKHAVSLQQLLQGVHTLTLYSVVAHQLIFLIQTLLIGESGLSLESRQLGSDIGQHKQLVIVYLLSQPGSTLIGQVAAIHLLIYYEVQRLNTLRHAAVIVLHVDILGILHTSLDTFLREELNQWLVLRHGLVRTVERQETGIQLLLCLFLVASLHQLVTLGNQGLGVGQILGGQLALNTYQLLNQWLILLEHLIVALGDRARDNQRCTGIVDQY